MLDSGAACSIIDLGSLERIGMQNFVDRTPTSNLENTNIQYMAATDRLAQTSKSTPGLSEHENAWLERARERLA